MVKRKQGLLQRREPHKVKGIKLYLLVSGWSQNGMEAACFCKVVFLDTSPKLPQLRDFLFCYCLNLGVVWLFFFAQFHTCMYVHKFLCMCFVGVGGFFRVIPSSCAHGLLLAPSPRIIPNHIIGTICDVRCQTGFSYMQRKCLNPPPVLLSWKILCR